MRLSNLNLIERLKPYYGKKSKQYGLNIVLVRKA